MIAAYHKNSKLPSTKSLSKKIQELTAAPKAAKTKGTKKAAGKTSSAKAAGKQAVSLWTEYERLGMTKAQAEGLSVYHVTVKIDPHCAMPIAGRQLIHNALASTGQVIGVRPEANSPAASKQVEFVLASAQTIEQISAKGRIPTIVGDVMIDLLLSPTAAAPKQEVRQPEAQAGLAPEESDDQVAEATPASAPAMASVIATQEKTLRVRIDAARLEALLRSEG